MAILLGLGRVFFATAIPSGVCLLGRAEGLAIPQATKGQIHVLTRTELRRG